MITNQQWVNIKVGDKITPTDYRKGGCQYWSTMGVKTIGKISMRGGEKELHYVSPSGEVAFMSWSFEEWAPVFDLALSGIQPNGERF